MRLKVGDKVQIICGNYKNRVSVIKSIDLKKNLIFFDKLITYKKNVKVSKKHPDGGQIEKNKGIDASNVMLVSPKSSSKKQILTRIAYKINPKTKKKVRICCKTKKEIKDKK